MNKIFYIINNLFKVPFFLNDFRKFQKLNDSWKCSFSNVLPILHEKTTSMGFDAHYVYHTGWAARVLCEISPQKHIDISSSIMFCSIASGFVPVEHYDFRTPDFKLDGIQCGVQNLQALTFPSDSINSLSCMHVIEHIGLGRYGDKINPRGDIQAAKELIRVLAPGGRLIIALPLAQKASIRFNAHRIYDYSRVLELFNTLDLTEFSFLSDLNGYKFFRHASLADVEGSSYGCGCFVFQKRLTCVK